MQCILKFGTYVLGMKAFLVDGVICVESNHDGIPCRVDFFQRLQERKDDAVVKSAGCVTICTMMLEFKLTVEIDWPLSMKTECSVPPALL